MVKTLKLLLSSLLALFLSGLLVLSVFFAFLQTQKGKELLTSALVHSAQKQGLALEIREIKGRLPFHWKLYGVKIAFERDLILSVERIKGRISLFSLLKKELYLKSLKLSSLRLEHPALFSPLALSLDAKGRWRDSWFPLHLFLTAFLESDPRSTLTLTATRAPKKRVSIELSTPLGGGKGELFLTSQNAIESASSTFFFNNPVPFSGKAHFQNNHLELTAASRAFQVGREDFSSACLSLKAQPQGERWEGVLTAEMQSDTLPIAMQANLSFDPGGSFALRDLDLAAPKATAGGSLQLRFSDLSMAGSLVVQAKELDRFATFLPGSRLFGELGGEIDFSSAPLQQTALLLSLNHFQFRELQAGHLLVKIQAQDLFTSPKGVASLNAEELKWKDLSMEEGSFQSHFEGERWPFELSAKGKWKDPFTLDLAGAYLATKDQEEMTLSSLQGKLLQKEFRMQKPFQVIWSPDFLKMTDCSLHFTGGYLQGECLLSKERSEVTLKTEHLPLDLLSLPFTSLSLSGGAGIDLKLLSTPEQLQGRLNLLLERVALFQYGQESPLIAKGSLSLHLDDDHMQLHTHLISSLHHFLILSATLPLSYSPFPFRLQLERERPFSAECVIDGRIEELFDFFDLKGQELKGHAMGQLFFSNTLSSPSATGGIRILDGAYENYTLGTSLKEIQAEVRGEKERLVLDHFVGKGASSGSLSATGEIALFFEKDFPYHFDAKLENVGAIDFDALSAQFVGPLHFDGTLHDLAIKGKLAASSVLITIPDELPTKIPELPVTLIHPPSHLESPPPPLSIFPIHYDLKIKASDHVFVRGRGLNSEWKGKAHIWGEDTDYKGEGDLSLLHGVFAFSGKDFSLTKGEITFSESGAQMEVRGNVQVADATITAILSGELTSPSLTFQSMPAMPTSSILSRLIFNKDISEITPFQAVQLAQMIVTLSGDSAPNLLEKIRSSLGVDRFNLVSTGAGSDEISLQIGKYLVEGVMVTLSQSAHSSQVIVEVELKAGFILQAETQEEEEGKFSLKWNHNY